MSSAPQRAMAAVAASDSLQQGDFMERLVESTVRSMFGQLRAEYQKELQEVLGAAAREQEPQPQEQALPPGTELRSLPDDSLLREAAQANGDPPVMSADKLPGRVQTSGGAECASNECRSRSPPVVNTVTSTTAGVSERMSVKSDLSHDHGDATAVDHHNNQNVSTLKMGHNKDIFKLTGKEEAMVKRLREDEERGVGNGFSYAQSFRRSASGRSLLSRGMAFSGLSTTKLWAYHIITRRSFDFFMGIIIILNSVTIGMETSRTIHGEKLPMWLVACEYTFLLIYISELMLRFHAVGVRTAMQSGWVRFDAVLVGAGMANLFMIATSSKGKFAETVVGNVNMLKLLRLFRLARTVRVFVQFRTLWLLVQGLMHAALPMLWTSLIMFIVTYVFAIIGMEAIVTGSGNSEYAEAATNFTSVWSSMLTLMQFMFLDSIAHLYQPLVHSNPLLIVYFTSFILIGPIALMSIVTAILVESSLRTANEDVVAKKAWDAIKKKEMVPKLRQLFASLDTNSDGEVDLEELFASSEEIKEQIQRIVALEEMEEIFHLLDIDGSGAVSIDEFIDGIMRSQEDKPSELLILVRQGRAILAELQQLQQLNK